MLLRLYKSVYKKSVKVRSDGSFHRGIRTRKGAYMLPFRLPFMLSFQQSSLLDQDYSSYRNVIPERQI
jgi:hypothetical protein